jgi:hypothetical protein
MNRFFALVLVAAFGLASAACKSTPSDPPKASTGDYKGENKIRFKEEPEPSSSSSGGPGAFDYAMVPFENIVYLPWKVIGGACKGGVDGVSAGFGKDSSGNQRMPIMGLLFSPLNLVTGFVTGAVEGAVIDPGVIGPTDSFGHSMGQPLRHPTSIWWY